MKVPLTAILVVACAGVATQFGCKEDDQIRSYQIRRPPRVDEPTADRPQDRLLAAIVPHGTRTWFFKVTGRAGALDEHIDSFRTFVKSVRFSDGEESAPTWTLPLGWQQQPASGMRFATLQFGANKEPFELTVIPLPSPPQDAAGYTLSNINRWRRQLDLSPLSAQQVAGQTEQLSLDGVPATIVNFLGHVQRTAMTSPQSAPEGQQPSPRPDQRAATAADPHAQKTDPHAQPGAFPLTYETPEGWVEGKTGAMRKAAFAVSDAGKHVEITVIDLDQAGADLLPNINRWRGQIQLQPTTQAELDQELKETRVGAATGHFVELIGAATASTRQAILGVIVINSGKAWFFKLMGDAELAVREKKRFLSFVESVRFVSSDGPASGE